MRKASNIKSHNGKFVSERGEKDDRYFRYNRSYYFNVCGSLFLADPSTAEAQKAVRQMQEELKKGDSVVTIGGLHGTVDSIDESKVVIKTGDNTRLTFDRRAIRETSAAE